jgi:hypothetical protein
VGLLNRVAQRELGVAFQAQNDPVSIGQHHHGAGFHHVVARQRHRRSTSLDKAAALFEQALQPVIPDRHRSLATPVVDRRLLAALPGIGNRGAHDLPAGAATPGQKAFPACQHITFDTWIRESVLWRLTQHVPSLDALSGPRAYAGTGA